MSTRKDLYAKIESFSADPEGWIMTTTAALAEALDKDATLVSRTLNSLARTGNIEVRKDDESGKMVAFRPVKPPRGYGNRSLNVVPPRRNERRDVNTGRSRVLVETPVIDKYAKAKEAYEAAAPALGEYASVEWHGNPLAEEALALKERNESLLAQVQELRTYKQSVARELEYLRKVNNKDLRKALADSGALVEHGA